MKLYGMMAWQPLARHAPIAVTHKQVYRTVTECNDAQPEFEAELVKIAPRNEWALSIETFTLVIEGDDNGEP